MTKIYFIIVAYLASVVLSRAMTLSPFNNGVYDYHRKIGFPLAEKLKNIEMNKTGGNLERIVGGSETLIASVPYQAGLLITVLKVFMSVCGGSIISDTKILTAAHCYSDGVSTADSITVVLGSSLLFSGGTRLDTSDVIVNPEFNPSTVTNDLAIVRVPQFSFSSLIQPVALPSGNEVNMDYIGFLAVASGYGMTSDENDIKLFQMVHSVTVPIISNSECSSSYGSYIQSYHLCTSGEGGRGTCGGDSGGPLVIVNNGSTVLVGVTSFGAQLCEDSHPSAFVRVTEFLPWLSEVN